MSQMLQIYGQLREMVLSLDLGPGERLTERWLETQFEGSRTPIRFDASCPAYCLSLAQPVSEDRSSRMAPGRAGIDERSSSL